MKRNFRALRHYNYRLYFFAQLVSMTGTWMQNVAQAWLVVILTGSAVALGTVTALQFLPISLLTLFAGVIIDRVPKRKLLLITQSAAALQAVILGMLVWLESVTLWQIYLLALFLGAVNAFDQPTRQAFVAEMVPDEDLPNAIAMNSLLFNAARTIGPAVAGAVIALVGIAPSFIINSATFIAVIIALLMMDESQLRSFSGKIQTGLSEGLKEGFQFVLRTPAIASLLLTLAFVGTFGFNFSTVLPLLVKFALRGGPEILGVITSAVGIGSMIGALLVASQTQPAKRLVYTFATCFGLLEVALALFHHYILSVVLLALIGMSGIAYTASTNTLLQLNSPQYMRGRVMSLYVVIFVGSTPIGALFTGLIAEAFGIITTILVEGMLCLVGVWIGMNYLRSKPTKIDTKVGS
ncbi:MAG: MFS transporter [Bacteroidota bacterium]